MALNPLLGATETVERVDMTYNDKGEFTLKVDGRTLVQIRLAKSVIVELDTGEKPLRRKFSLQTVKG